MGVERLLALLAEKGEPVLVPLDVYLVHQGERASALAPRLAERLRDAGLRVVLHCGGGGFKSQMKKADASGAQVAVILGEDEVQAEEVSVKPLRIAQPQVRVPVAEVAQWLREGAWKLPSAALNQV
jgi:histidyl-tRNA synthetase